MNNKGQFSIIAALLISVVLVSTVIVTYTMILNDSIQVQPQVLTAIDETNFAIKQILGFSVGYYGSVIRVTGDNSFANQSTLNYTSSGLEYVANTHAEWGAGFSLTNLTISTYWFNNTSYSTGFLSVTYNLTKLGIYGVQYAPSCKLMVQITNTTQNNQTSLVITADQNEPVTDLTQQNFHFFQYCTNSTWTLVTPGTSPTVYTNGTYQIQPPAGIDADSYVIQVTDQRGISVVASPYSSYNINITWPTLSSTASSTNYYVNNNAADVDSNRNIGTESNFTAQQYGPDKINDTLAEATAASSSFGNPTQSGSSRSNVAANSILGGSFTSPAYATTLYNITFYGRFGQGTNGNVKAVLVLQSNLNIVTNGVSGAVSIGSTADWYTCTFSTPATISPNTAYVLMIIPDTSSFRLYYTATTGGTAYGQANNNYATPTNPTSATSNTTQYSIYANCSLAPNYRLDLEEQWTNINYGAMNASLDIFTGPFSSPTETLSVQCWNTTNSSWSTLISSLNANSWNNVSVTPYLSGPTFTIRFLDGTQTGDSVQNSWQIDATLLYLNGTLQLVPPSDSITIELLQNGTMRWLGQSLQMSTQAMPIPPIPTKSIHLNQTMNGINSEVSFQIEDWASNYLVPLGMTSNSSILSGANMIVFPVNDNVSKVTLWWNGSDLATQTPYAFVDRYFTGDNPTAGSLTNGILTLQFTGNFQPVISSVGSTSSNANFMRINGQASTYGAGPAYIISFGVVRDIVQQEAEWGGGVTNCPNVYSQIVLTLPANATYYTYQLRTMFVQSQQSRTITDLCPIELQSSITQAQTENGTSSGYPIVSTATGTFYNQSTIWAHHWSQLISGTNGAGIMFTDSGNNQLYSLDSIAGTQTGGLRINAAAGTIELLPVSNMAPVSFTYALDTIWYGAVSTFSNTTPIYQISNGQISGAWTSVEYPPTAAPYTGT